MHVHIGSDHAGYALKGELTQFLRESGFTVEDHGTYTDQSVDYPDFAHPVADAVERDGVRGILICGSANGVCITANKHQGIRAALCWTEEIAGLARQHNDANIVCVPARFVTSEQARSIVKRFLETPFEGGRHTQRVNKIACTR